MLNAKLNVESRWQGYALHLKCETMFRHHLLTADRCLLPAVRNANLQFISTFECSGNGDLIGILKVGAHGDTVSEPGHLIAKGF